MEHGSNNQGRSHFSQVISEPVRASARGVAAAAAVSVVLYGAALIIGLAASGSRLVFLAGAGFAFVGMWLPADLKRSTQAVGASLVVVAALVFGLLSEFGWLQICAAAGSLGAVIWLAQPSRRETAPNLPLWVVPVTAVAFVALTLGPLALDGGTLGHDESAYALKGRSWLQGTPDSGWGLHRGVAMSGYAYIVLGLGAAEGGLRLLGVVATLGLVGATWALATRISNKTVGAFAAVAVVAGPAVLRRGTEFLSDIPSTALLLACLLIAWVTVMEPETSSYRVLWLLPLAWLAFYLRYQSILSFALIALTLIVLRWSTIRVRPGPILALVALGGLGLIPHALFAIQEAGTPWGIIVNTGLGAPREFLGEGLIDYVGLLAWRLGGFVGPLAAVAFLLGTWRFRHTDNLRRYLFLLIPAVAQVLVLGIISHGESRFVFFPFALTVVGGTMAVHQWSPEVRRTARRSLVAGLVIIVVGSIAVSAAATRRGVENRALLNEAVELASEQAERAAGGKSCAILTSAAPQVTFYSKCLTDIFRGTLEASEAVARLVGGTKLMILIEDGKRQPEGEDLAELVSLTDQQPVLVEGLRSRAVVHFFSD